ncbi:MAG: 50S ribosomal protein L29 [Nanoarchaeota archaeon]|nr:50S ribosomal protein L29 [Nanoarchaeota archaeon]
MKIKELQEWRKKKMEEIRKETEGLRERLVGLRIDLAVGKVKNIREARLVKKSIAQLETIQNEKLENSK